VGLGNCADGCGNTKSKVNFLICATLFDNEIEDNEIEDRPSAIILLETSHIYVILLLLLFCNYDVL